MDEVVSNIFNHRLILKVNENIIREDGLNIESIENSELKCLFYDLELFD